MCAPSRLSIGNRIALVSVIVAIIGIAITLILTLCIDDNDPPEPNQFDIVSEKLDHLGKKLADIEESIVEARESDYGGVYGSLIDFSNAESSFIEAKTYQNSAMDAFMENDWDAADSFIKASYEAASKAEPPVDAADGINPWMIMGPIISMAVVGLLVWLMMNRRKYQSE